MSDDVTKDGTPGGEAGLALVEAHRADESPGVRSGPRRTEQRVEEPLPEGPRPSLWIRLRSFRLSGWRLDVAAAMASAAMASAIAALTLRLDLASLSRPFQFQGDALFYAGMIKGTVENGWYLSNPDLGAPIGMESAAFPLLHNDVLHLLIVKVLGVFLSPIATFNAFFLLTFPLCAVVAYWAMRRLGLSVGPALVCSVLYAVLPYHFLRSESHLFFTSYYGVPVACVLVLSILGGDTLFERRRASNRLLSWVTPRTLGTLLMAAVVASSSAYYLVFALILVAAATVGRLIAEGRWRALLPGLAAMTAMVVVAVALQLPYLMHRVGEPKLVAERLPAESELYGLKLDQLVFPIGGHRFEPFADFAQEFETTTVPRSELMSYLGLIATVGLGWLLVVGFAAAVQGRVRLGGRRERDASIAAVVAFLVATVGGFSAVFAYLVSPQIRSWNRMSIVIAFFALLAIGLVLDRIRTRAATPRAKQLFAGLLAVLVLIGAYDQTSSRYTPDYAEAAATFDDVSALVGRIEELLPEGSSVLQLPYFPFPEHVPIRGMNLYGHMQAYLTSTELRWSYGAVEGTKEDWHRSVADAPLTTLLDAAAVAGFSGVWVELAAYPEDGAALVGDLTGLLGAPSLESDSGRHVFWDLRSYMSELVDRLTPEALEALRGDILEPVRVFYGDTFAGLEGEQELRWRWARADAEIELVNSRDEPQRLVFDAEVRAATDDAGDAVFEFPDGTSQTVPLGTAGARVRQEFVAPVGASAVRITARNSPVATAPDATGEESVTQVVNPLVFPEAACLGRPTAACTTGPRPQIP
jgi:phosphoglycerol transferase